MSDRETCRFVPEVLATRYDDKGNEVDTEEPGAGCAAFCCSECGFAMLFGEFDSWFDFEPPYTPRFNYCPNCGRKVRR